MRTTTTEAPAQAHRTADHLEAVKVAASILKYGGGGLQYRLNDAEYKTMLEAQRSRVVALAAQILHAADDLAATVGSEALHG